jgi:hypothetical protein
MTRNDSPATRIVVGLAAEPGPPARAARRLRALLDAGARLAPAGRAREDPSVLLAAPYLPRHEVRLFDATFLLSDYLHDEALGFLVAYVILGERRGDGRVARVQPRIFYKDSSLVWRVASHFVHDADEYWIGKGDVHRERLDGGEYLCSMEETTNLPYEIQAALDAVSRARKRRRDDDAVPLVLREGPSGRIEPYADFVAPRRRAAARWRVTGGRPVARFARRGDPRSLRFAAGFEPDLDSGLLEESHSESRFFGGAMRKVRALSKNRSIQYLFYASPTHVWIGPPQTLTTELSTYGVRVDDVPVDEELCIPAYEYHEDGHSQIPAGFAGAPHPDDPHRADASAWLEELEPVREFRRKVLGGRPGRERPASGPGSSSPSPLDLRS